MKKIILIFIFCSCMMKLYSQVNNYYDAMKEGDKEFNKKEYKKAINYYFAAAAFMPENKGEVKEKVNKAFDAIEALRKKADDDKDRAVNAEREANKQKALTELERNKAHKSDSITKIALAKANKLVSRFNFYLGRFALVYGILDVYGLPALQAFFIDTNGDEVGKLGNWDKADPFDINTGFAKVETTPGNKDTLLKYLIDTSGHKYPVANSLKEMNNQIKVLDISTDQLINELAKGLGKQSEIEILILKKTFENKADIQTVLLETSKLYSGFWYLILADCKLDSLSSQIGLFKNLSKLDLHSNEINKLPAEIGDLKYLQFLNLSSNKLDTLPGYIGNLENLTTLDLSYNQLSILPDHLKKLKKLKNLYLQGNLFSKQEQHKIESLLQGCYIKFKEDYDNF